MAKGSNVLLHIDPTEIIFNPPIDKPVTTELKLQNVTQSVVSFKVKTTAPKRYIVRPNTGLIEPGMSHAIKVVLNFAKEEAVGDTIEDKFQIQSVVVNSDTSAEDTNALLKTVWASAPAEAVRKQRLKCTIKTGGATVPATPATTSPAQNVEYPELLHSTTDIAASKIEPLLANNPTASVAPVPPATATSTAVEPQKPTQAPSQAKQGSTSADTQRTERKILVKPTIPDQPHHAPSDNVATLGFVPLTQVNVVILLVLSFLMGMFFARVLF